MMLATGKAKIRGKCPECGTPVWLTVEELAAPLQCNICDTAFHIHRKLRKRWMPGRPRTANFRRSMAVPEAARRLKPLLFWLLAMLVLLLLALLFLGLGGSSANDSWFPRRLW